MTAEFVLSELQSVGSPEKAAHLSRFFKTGPGQYGEGDRFLGVVVPQTRSIAKANKAMPLDELQRLLDSPWHEARLCALLVLVYRFQDKKTPEAEREKMYRFYLYLQPIITQYFIDNKSEIWLLFLIAHSKR